MTLVNIEVLNDDIPSSGVESVLVEVYNTSNVFQTSGSTDGDGIVAFSLADGSYYIYLRKEGVSFLPSQPQALTVTGPDVNVFEVICHEREEPESVNPLRCTVSGKILSVNGLSKKTRLIFEPVKDLIILSGNVIAPQSRFEVSSDEDGYFEFELLRDTKYNAYFLFPQDLFGQQPGKLDVITPDSTRVDLHRLLFPVPVDFAFSVSSISLPLTPTVDESVEVDVTFSDGSIRGGISTAWAGLSLDISDNRVADVSISDNTLLIKPLSIGTITVSAIRSMADSIIYDPVPDFSSETLTITIA